MDKLVPKSWGSRFEYHCYGVEVGTVNLHVTDKVLWTPIGEGIRRGERVGNKMEVWSLEIYPEYQGLGHGRALMQQIYAMAHHQGCETVWLRVNKDNAVARSLYEKEGFVIVNERTHDYEMERTG